MRRYNRAGGAAALARSSAAPVPEAVMMMRTYNSELNPSRPVRPSPLTASTIQGMPLDVLDRIRSFPLFLSAPESFLTAIGNHLRPQSHSPNDFILTEGDEAKAMYWLVRGAVAVTSRDGESTYAELKPGAFFGEIGTLMGMPRTANIVARTKCLLLVLKKEDLLKELPQFPEVEKVIREEAQERLSILHRKKRESSASSFPRSPFRGEKRARDGDDEGDESDDTLMGDLEGGRANGGAMFKRRKSPSPGLADFAASSALGSGMVHVRQLLKELPLFSGLPSDHLHFLGLNAQQKTYPPFTDIIQQDSQGREIYFIVRGEVEVIDEKAFQNDGRSPSNGLRRHSQIGLQVKARLKQGQYFGEVVSLSLAPRRTATVRSVTSVECLMISGNVLTEFWNRCPPALKKQVQKTAEERLQSGPDEDTPMPDTPDSNLSIDELAIADCGPSTRRRQSYPTLSLSLSKPESPHKPSRFEDRPVLEPFDPDPFLNTPELDNGRRFSRRSSLAPPPDDDPMSTDTSRRYSRRSSLAPTPDDDNKPIEKPASRKLPPLPKFNDGWLSPSKGPKIMSRHASQFNKGRLPDSVLELIFSHLDLHDLMRLRLVSLHWSKLLKDSPRLLTNLDLSRYNRVITDDTLIHSICPFVGGRPRHIDISNCFHITDHGFAALAATCSPKALSWRMKSVWDITAQAVNEMVTQAKDLEEIDLSNCRKVSDTLLARVVGWVVDGPATQLNYSRNARYASAHRHQPPVQAVPIGHVYGCPKLRKITLSYCKHVTDRSMAHLAAYAHARLEDVDLTRCTTITDQGFQTWGQKPFSRLRRLCLADCTYLTDNAIVYLTNAAKGLRDLDLSFCCALSDTATEVVALGCPHLTSLNLSFCGSAVSDSSLGSIGLHLLELRYLSVRGCVRVTGKGVEAVMHGCVQLTDLDVSQCKNLIPWFEDGGLARARRGVRFEIVAKDKRRN